MLHATIIAHGQTQKRWQQLKSIIGFDPLPDPDTLIIKPDPSITIQTVRSIEKFLSKKAYHKDLKLVIIIKADQLTLPAQNALLKTLEEPPAHSQIFLLTAFPDQLLPTIISRCQIINLPTSYQLSPPELKKQAKLFQQISTASLSQKIILAGQLAKNKNEALLLCQQQLIYLRILMLKKPSSTVLSLLKHINNSINQLNANVHPQLCLENLFLQFSPL